MPGSVRFGVHPLSSPKLAGGCGPKTTGPVHATKLLRLMGDAVSTRGLYGSQPHCGPRTKRIVPGVLRASHNDASHHLMMLSACLEACPFHLSFASSHHLAAPPTLLAGEYPYLPHNGSHSRTVGQTLEAPTQPRAQTWYSGRLPLVGRKRVRRDG